MKYIDQFEMKGVVRYHLTKEEEERVMLLNYIEQLMHVNILMFLFPSGYIR